MEQSYFRRPAFWYGVYYGVAVIIFFSLVYAINFEFFGRFFLWMLINVMVLVTFLTMGGIAERRANGGYLKYFDAVKALFFIGMIGYLINLVFTLLFVNVIDPDYYKNLGEVMKESTMKMLQDFNVPDEKMDETMENMDKQMAQANAPFTYLKQFFGALGMSIVFALICALFVKRNPPEGIEDSQILDTQN